LPYIYTYLLSLSTNLLTTFFEDYEAVPKENTSMTRARREFVSTLHYHNWSNIKF